MWITALVCLVLVCGVPGYLCASDSEPAPPQVKSDDRPEPTVGATLHSLIHELRNGDEPMRVRAAESLRSNDLSPMHTRESVFALARALKDESARVRLAAAKSIREFGSKARLAIPYLVEALEDEDEMARYYTACAITSIGPASIPALIEALHEDAPRVREEAIRVLKWMGPEAVYSLMASADRESTEKEALEWLKVLPGTWITGDGDTLQLAATAHHSFSWMERPPTDWWCTWDKAARCLIIGTCESIQLAAVFSKFYRLHLVSDDLAEGVLVKEHRNQYGAVVQEEHVARVTICRMSDDKLVIRCRRKESTLTRARQ